MDLVQLLGVNVRHHRKLKGMSQEQLALEAGMERSYVSVLERGTRNPSVRVVGRLVRRSASNRIGCYRSASTANQPQWRFPTIRL